MSAPDPPAQPPRRVLVVYGTRPELIKLAPVIFELRRRQDHFTSLVCSTAQHRELIDDLQELFGIEPDYDLNLMRHDQRLNELASRALTSVDDLLQEVDPDWTLVQGDTTTAMVTSLAAFHLGYRLGHVEAGLRTGDLRAPFPEEANRRIIDTVADLLLAPTRRAAETLLAEGHSTEKTFLVGNTVVDALQWVAESLPDESPTSEVLITVHRRESFGQPLLGIVAAIRDLAGRFPETQWVLPVHRNPNVAGPIHEGLSQVENVKLCDPLRYDDLVRCMRRARIVLTDSGGIQEEAPTFGKPLLVLRDKTERPEGVEAGVARLVGTDRGRIVEEATRLLTDEAAHRAMASKISPYGDGQAAGRIGAILAGEPFRPFDPNHEPP